MASIVGVVTEFKYESIVYSDDEAGDPQHDGSRKGDASPKAKKSRANRTSRMDLVMRPGFTQRFPFRRSIDGTWLPNPVG